MYKNKISKNRKVLKLCITLILISFTLIIIIAIIHRIMIKIENKKYCKYGEFIEIEGKKMYYSQTGTGDKTIVILPGSGCVGSTILYRPLAKKLSEKYNVIIIEYFGYGFSDDTSEERSIDKMVEEIRICLDKIATNNKYILMPHSISGLYAQYYAEKYPEEVQAIIGLDMSVAEGELGIDWNVLYKNTGITQEKYLSRYNVSPFLNVLLQKTGIFRLISNVYFKEDINELIAFNLYTKEEIDTLKAELNRYPSEAFLNEGREEIWKNYKIMENYKYPKELPVLQFLSKYNVENLENIFGYNYTEINTKLITNNNKQFVKTVEGMHNYIYLHSLNEIIKETEIFLNELS